MGNSLLISRQDLLDNAVMLRDYLHTPIIAVVKCNGYGLGIDIAVRAWYDAGIRFFGVSEPEEALQIRECGYHDVDILLMAPVANVQTLQKMCENNVILTVTNVENARFVVTAANGIPVRAHVKINTGMGRFGLRWSELDAIRSIYDVEGIAFEGIYSHFAASFEKGNQNTALQYGRFMAVVELLQKNGVQVGMKHIANSAAALRFENARLDAVRIGSALTGRISVSSPVPLKKIGKVKAPVVDIANLKKGDTSGYSMLYHCPADTTAAVIQLGYHHGFGICHRDDNFYIKDILRNWLSAVRNYKKQPVVDFNGQKLPVLGRIGNQYTLIDVKNSGIKPGDFVMVDMPLLSVSPTMERIIED